MNMIYISHPFTGDQERNRQDSIRIQAELQNDNPDEVYINPLRMFEQADYYQVLAQCFEVLSRCDKAIFCKDWEKSWGCQAEMAYCIAHNIPVETCES